MKTILSMFIVFTLLSGSFAISSESKDVGNASTDEIYQKKIIGKWYSKNKYKSEYLISSFEKGGYTGHGYMKMRKKRNYFIQ